MMEMLETIRQKTCKIQSRLSVPPTYSDYYGYYVEVWTRYPTDGESVDSQSLFGSTSDAAAPTPSTTPADTIPAVTSNPRVNDACDLCGEKKTNMAFSGDLIKCVCSDCYKTSAGKAYMDG